jgi:Ca-activated chloride channel family protein
MRSLPAQATRRRVLPAMQAALTDRRDGNPDGLRQVVFLTDGEIGNDQQLCDTIAAMHGRSRG